MIGAGIQRIVLLIRGVPLISSRSSTVVVFYRLSDPNGYRTGGCQAFSVKQVVTLVRMVFFLVTG